MTVSELDRLERAYKIKAREELLFEEWAFGKSRKEVIECMSRGLCLYPDMTPEEVCEQWGYETCDMDDYTEVRKFAKKYIDKGQLIETEFGTVSLR